MVTEKEIENAVTVQAMLNQLDYLTVVPHKDREDLFTLTVDMEGEAPDVNILLDVEESIVALIADVCEGERQGNVVSDYTLNKAIEFNEFLLEQNAKASHGAFALNGNQVVFRENLEIENLDLNELDEAIKSVAIMVSTSIEKILEIKAVK